MKDIAASTLAKLKNKSKEFDIPYQKCLQLFAQEEFLRRLSKSNYANKLVLKGGFFIYTFTNFESRATVDVDFLLRHTCTTKENVQEIIEEILLTPTGNEYIKMQAGKFEEISTQRKYKGISSQIIAEIKNVRIPFSIDIGVDDVIFPDAQNSIVNTQLAGFEQPEIKTYTLVSVIAEKFDAILQRFEMTSRMKDFYDIYYISQTFDFEGLTLQEALFETLHNRKTVYSNDSFERIMALADETVIQKRWNLFLKNMPGIYIELTTIMEGIESFLKPVFVALVDEQQFFMTWSATNSQWK